MAAGSQHSAARGARGSQHYFSADPSAPSHPAEISLDLPDLTLTLRTDRGTFSPTRVDPGTKVLLRELSELDNLPEGPVVDLGCGYGPIACTLARRMPDRTVWAVDVNERARSLCAANAVTAGVRDRVRVLSPEDVPPGPVAAIVSNPPIRIGKVALHELLAEWLERLAPRGAAWFVVQRHLGADSLARWLAEQGWGVVRERSRKGYRVLRVIRAATEAGNVMGAGPDRP